VKKLLVFLTPVFFLATLYVNYLSGTGKINGISAGDVSKFFPTFFTPAGYTFSIWGVIYLFNLVFVSFLFFRGLNDSNNFPSIKIMALYSATCLINIAWVYNWHYQNIFICELLMLIFLSALAIIYNEITNRVRKSIWEYIVTVIPISIYFSWIIVATLANTAVMITYANWNIFGIPQYYQASFMLLIAALVNIWVLLKKKDIFFSLVYLWAAMGIISARRAELMPGSNNVAIIGLITMIIIFIMILFVRFVSISKTIKS